MDTKAESNCELYPRNVNRTKVALYGYSKTRKKNQGEKKLMFRMWRNLSPLAFVLGKSNGVSTKGSSSRNDAAIPHLGVCPKVGILTDVWPSMFIAG